MDISVITVNYKTPDLIASCIESVLMQKDINFEMVVIDNASQDMSLSIIENYADKIKIIANTDNAGFGKANNQGFKLTSGRYIFLLNPDAKLLTNVDLENAITYMEKNPDIGLAGTKIIDSHHKHVETITDHYPRQKQAFENFSHLPGKWATVLGASMVIRRDVYEKLNGFDEDFFLYAEETDLCLRVRKLGYKIGYNEQVTVGHVGSASIRKSPPAEVILRKKQAKYLFYKKHYSQKAVINIIKDDMRHAKWHLMRLWLKKMLRLAQFTDNQKYLRHKISFDVAAQFLKSVNS